MVEYTVEQLEAARKAKSPEELITIAEKAGVKLGEEDAIAFLATVTENGEDASELSDEELDNVAGGYCHDSQGREIVTLITFCLHGEQTVDLYGRTGKKTCSDGGSANPGGNCSYISYEKGIWYCNYNLTH